MTTRILAIVIFLLTGCAGQPAKDVTSSYRANLPVCGQQLPGETLCAAN